MNIIFNFFKKYCIVFMIYSNLILKIFATITITLIFLFENKTIFEKPTTKSNEFLFYIKALNVF